MNGPHSGFAQEISLSRKIRTGSASHDPSRYQHKDHVAVGKAVLETNHPHWVMTYDDVPAIRKIYAKCQVRGFSLRYTAQLRRDGAEVFIAPKGMLLPRGLLKAV